MNRRPAIAAALLLLLPGAALAQVFVIPRRAEKSAVNTFDFEWRHVDILVGPAAQGEAKPRDGTDLMPPGVPGGPIPSAPTTPPNIGGPQTPGSEPPQETKELTSEPPGNGVEATEVAIADGGMGSPDGGVVASDMPPVPLPPLVAALGADGGTGSADAGPKYATSLGAATGGVRFYFYERERLVAERAAPVIEDAYRYLVDQFHYVPTQTFPYILYNSYQEFLQTNVFFVQEGTLGVTSTEDLKLSLPYLGDHKLFEEISTHELAHQFTIQKVRTLAENKKSFGDPLGSIPLWFIEGLAEFYAKRGLDPEAEMLVRDLMVNPDLMRGYAYLDFFSPGPYGYLWIYKMGQARVAFMEEAYGAGFTQRVLEESTRLVGGSKDAPSLKFEELLERLTGEEPKKISARFENWIKRRAFKDYLAAEQSGPVMELLEERTGITTAMNSSPDGKVILYRTIMPDTGESRLYLVDPEVPDSALKVANDGEPGTESLHPIFGRNFALAKDKLAYVAESNARDVIYVQGYTRTAEQREEQGLVRRNAVRTGHQKRTVFAVDLDLGDRTAYRVGQHALLGVPAVAFSPDGQWLAFIGINDAGIRDVYALALKDGEDAKPVKLTDDIFAERQLTWGPSGIVFTSDATSHRHFNLFRVKPEAPGVVERLTTGERDEADPLALEDGRIFFVAYNQSSSELHELMADGSVTRRTDVTTGVFEPGPGPEGGLWMLLHQSGERRPAMLRPPKMLSLATEASPPAAPPSPLALRPLTDSEDYRPFARQNIEVGPIFGLAGAGSGGFFGQVFAMASDKMRDHAMVLNLAVYGSFELSDGVLLYVNQEHRSTWGTGLFQSLRFRIDDSFLSEGVTFFSGERYFGAVGSLRYPFNSFVYLQGDLTLGGASYFLGSDTAFRLNNPSFNNAGRDLYTPWIDANDDVRFQAELTGQLGYNDIRYHYATGPLSGSSALLEATVGTQPFNDEAYTNLRLDLERYFPIYGRANIFVRAAGGTAFGGRYARSYFLSSFDTLRGVNFGDEDWLLGRNFVYSTIELQVPLNDLIRVAFLSDLEAIAGVDAGGVGNTADRLWARRTLDLVAGFNIALGPLLMRLHFARPMDIGNRNGKPDDGWVTNFSIGLAGLNGFFDHRGDRPVRPPSLGSGFTSGTRPGL
ncbi:tolB protein precursor protein [Hyalangium rubrum]|uniref:TolB protein protein n=1 Tax=Hyalangium rubrum TaxID=3103134 RepID=A0ABU5GWJ1_9BACT|nr:tolB protein precursor protein [Hyalangium sp. s54d21]MDY7225558.1 tolB protein precursor protein [Hyalangium sp. s54d21]